MPEYGPKDWFPGMSLAIKVNAGHDSNGNPRRGWMITSCSKGETLDFVDEGYHGSSILRREYPRAVVGPEFQVTPGQYRDLKRTAEKAAKEKSKSQKSKQKPELGNRNRKGESMATVKRSVPPVLMAWVHCRKASGVKPGVKMSQKQKMEARTCVMKQLRGKK